MYRCMERICGQLSVFKWQCDQDEPQGIWLYCDSNTFRDNNSNTVYPTIVTETALTSSIAYYDLLYNFSFRWMSGHILAGNLHN